MGSANFIDPDGLPGQESVEEDYPDIAKMRPDVRNMMMQYFFGNQTEIHDITIGEFLWINSGGSLPEDIKPVIGLMNFHDGNREPIPIIDVTVAIIGSHEGVGGVKAFSIFSELTDIVQEYLAALNSFVDIEPKP